MLVDTEPRRLTAEQNRMLDALRRQAQVGATDLRLNLIELEAALTERDRRGRQAALIGELRASLDKVDKLSALMPYCSTCEMNIVIPATPTAIPTVSEGVRQLLERGGAEARLMPVELALDEALASAIRHGCKGDPTKQVQCIVTADASGV